MNISRAKPFQSPLTPCVWPLAIEYNCNLDVYSCIQENPERDKSYIEYNLLRAISPNQVTYNLSIASKS